jgi:hypothetical protein
MGHGIHIWNKHLELGTCIFVRKRIMSAVKRVEFVSDKMSYVILRGQTKQTPWSESASELYRPNDRRLSAK